MSQLAYTVDQAAALEAQLADSGVHDIMTKENTAIAVPFGRFVVRDTADNSCKLPGLSTDITNALLALGLALRHQALESSASGAPTYPIKSAVNVLKKGRAWVKVEEDVTPGSTVHVRYAAGGNGVGSFGDTTGTSERAPLAGAKYLSTALANALALIEFDL